MDNKYISNLKGALVVPIGLVIVLIPFSIFIGWNLVTLILFWFVITPGLTIYLPKIVLKKIHHPSYSLVGFIIFYTFMVFMTYKHYMTDYFQIMALSCIINLVLMSTIWIRSTRTQTQ